MNIRALMLGSAALVAVSFPALAQDAELLVFDWSGFEDPKIHPGYAEQHGDVPTHSFYADDDEAFQKVSSGFRPDIVHPCSQMVAKYRDADLIEPWDVSRIPGYADVNPALNNSPVFHDDGGVWFLPTDWASTAVAWNTEEVPPEDVASLQVFTDPKYEGRLSITDNVDDAWSLALLATGVSDWTNLTEEQFAAGAEWLRKAHPNVRAYWSDSSELAQLMASGEVLIAWSWPDAVTQLKSDGFPIGFQREAKEGSAAFLCGFINMKDGPGNEDKAYDYLNAWYDVRSAAGLLEVLGYGHASDKAMAQFAPEVLAEAGLGPISAPVLSQLPIATEMRTRMQEEFEKIKAGF